MKQKILGFYDFDVTAEKTKDFLLRNNFDPGEVSIMPVKKGQRFSGSPGEPAMPAAETDLAGNQDHSSIITFFRHLFNIEGKGDHVKVPLEADRNGFILAVIADTEEKKILAQETLDSHGAAYIQTADIL
jgi:hypothetical protein